MINLFNKFLKKKIDAELTVEQVTNFFIWKIRTTDGLGDDDKINEIGYKSIYLACYAYVWYLGLKGQRLFKEKIAHVNGLGFWVYSEIIRLKRLKTLELPKIVPIDSYDNPEIAKYLPKNVVLTMDDHGLYLIVRFRDFDNLD